MYLMFRYYMLLMNSFIKGTYLLENLDKDYKHNIKYLMIYVVLWTVKFLYKTKRLYNS